jgi:hypothetical protein
VTCVLVGGPDGKAHTVKLVTPGGRIFVPRVVQRRPATVDDLRTFGGGYDVFGHETDVYRLQHVADDGDRLYVFDSTEAPE